MYVSRDSSNEKNTHKISTNKNETSSSFSSDSDQTPKPFTKKKKVKNTSTQLFTPDYFPMYTPRWATMNYVYLDLMRQLSLESEIRNSLTKMDKEYDYSYLKDFQAKKTFKEKQCCSRRKTKGKQYSCEDFKEFSSHLCLSCHQKIKCSSCGQTILPSRASETGIQENKPLNHCNCTYNSYPTLLDIQHIPLSCCHYHCQRATQPCNSLSHKPCGSLKHVSIDTPVREIPEIYKSTRRAQNSLNSEACNTSNSNLEDLLSENSCSVGKSITKNCSALQIANNKDETKEDSQDDCTIVSNFIGGTGDERSKLQVKRTRKSRPPQSTAYFLPISSLSPEYINQT